MTPTPRCQMNKWIFQSANNYFYYTKFTPAVINSYFLFLFTVNSSVQKQKVNVSAWIPLFRLVSKSGSFWFLRYINTIYCIWKQSFVVSKFYLNFFFCQTQSFERLLIVISWQRLFNNSFISLTLCFIDQLLITARICFSSVSLIKYDFTDQWCPAQQIILPASQLIRINKEESCIND